MASLYVRSTDGSDADNGTTWALAKATLAGAAAIDAAGDVIYVSQSHAETTGAAVSLAFAGTAANPVQVICGDDSNAPPTSDSTAATVAVTGNFGLTISGSVLFRGISFTIGTGTSSGTATAIGTSGVRQVYELCEFISGATHANGSFNLGSTSSGVVCDIEFKSTDVKFALATQSISVRQSNFRWSGGSILSGGTSPTSLITFGGSGAMALLENLDLSNAASTLVIFYGNTIPVKAVIRNSKLPASWTGSLGTPTAPAQRFEMHNCDSVDTNYRMVISDYFGTAVSETTIVRAGGASDETTPLSWKMTTSASSTYPMNLLESPEIAIWNDVVGSSITVSVEIVHDSQGAGTAGAFLDNEIWINVKYLGTSGYPLGSTSTDAKAILATAADQDSSSETWTTTGLTTPVKQKLSVSFTAQEVGYVHIKVCLAKASKTVYVCPKVVRS